MIFYEPCEEALIKLADASINCVVTSPPYADRRKKQYGGIPEADYPQWTVSYMRQIKRVLMPNSSVAIVIRPHIKDGVISDYVLRTRLALREDGWFESEELIWIKTDSPPMGHNQRPRRAWESILWFSNSRIPYCDPKANGVQSDRLGLESKKGVGSYVHTPTKAESGIARCRDYVEVGTSKVNRDPENHHTAQYPEELAMWIMNLLCPPGGTVLDPFIGSGTTAVAAIRTGRNYVGIEKDQTQQRIIEKRILAAMGSVPGALGP